MTLRTTAAAADTRDSLFEIGAESVTLPLRLRLVDDVVAMLVLPTGLLAEWTDLDPATTLTASEQDPRRPLRNDPSAVLRFLNAATDAADIVRAVKDDPLRHPARRGYGVRPTVAKRLLEHRDRIGGFTRLGQLQDVHGVGPDTAHDITVSLQRVWGAVASPSVLSARWIVLEGARRIASFPLRMGHVFNIGGRLEFVATRWRLTVAAIVGLPSDSFVHAGWRHATTRVVVGGVST